MAVGGYGTVAWGHFSVREAAALYRSLLFQGTPDVSYASLDNIYVVQFLKRNIIFYSS